MGIVIGNSYTGNLGDKMICGSVLYDDKLPPIPLNDSQEVITAPAGHFFGEVTILRDRIVTCVHLISDPDSSYLAYYDATTGVGIATTSVIGGTPAYYWSPGLSGTTRNSDSFSSYSTHSPRTHGDTIIALHETNGSADNEKCINFAYFNYDGKLIKLLKAQISGKDYDIIFRSKYDHMRFAIGSGVMAVGIANTTMPSHRASLSELIPDYKSTNNRQVYLFRADNAQYITRIAEPRDTSSPVYSTSITDNDGYPGKIAIGCGLIAIAVPGGGTSSPHRTQSYVRVHNMSGDLMYHIGAGSTTEVANPYGNGITDTQYTNTNYSTIYTAKSPSNTNTTQTVTYGVNAIESLDIASGKLVIGVKNFYGNRGLIEVFELPLGSSFYSNGSLNTAPMKANRRIANDGPLSSEDDELGKGVAIGSGRIIAGSGNADISYTEYYTPSEENPIASQNVTKTNTGNVDFYDLSVTSTGMNYNVLTNNLVGLSTDNLQYNVKVVRNGLIVLGTEKDAAIQSGTSTLKVLRTVNQTHIFDILDQK